MTSSQADSLAYRRYRAPRGDRTSLVVPPFSEVGTWIEQNRQRLAQANFDFDGRSHKQLAAKARAHLIRQATDYTRSYRDVALPTDSDLVFLSGHQPEMFHPGVWFKNFALSQLTQLAPGVGVHLLIDNDTVSDPSIRVAGGTPQEPSWSTVAYDAAGPEIPYEERGILDRSLMDTFAARVIRQTKDWVRHPLIEEYWPRVLARSAVTNRLGLCLSQARHQAEAAWGLNTLELPQSVVCQSEPFGWFAAHVLSHLARFREVYNRAVHSYRANHNIRSANHPVPDLHHDGDWLEAPFWIWHATDPRRRGLYARRTGGTVELTDRARWRIQIPGTDDASGAQAGSQLLELLEQQQVRLRTRALTTTLWARLVLSDLFLHGIGGAKYDQLTDALLAGFYGVQPPGYLTLSATLQLPVEHPTAPAADPGELQQQLWALRHHPEAFATGDSADGEQAVQRLVEEKRRWVSADNSRERCQRIRRVNEQLQAYVQPQREKMEAALEQRRQWERAQAIRTWREYSFGLHDSESLRGFMLAIQPTSLYVEQKHT